MGSYVPGEVIRISGQFRVGTTLTDPGVVTLRITKADGTESVLVSPAVINDGVGLYHADVDADTLGVWTYRWEGTAPAKGATEGDLSVRTIYGG